MEIGASFKRLVPGSVTSRTTGCSSDVHSQTRFVDSLRGPADKVLGFNIYGRKRTQASNAWVGSGLCWGLCLNKNPVAFSGFGNKLGLATALRRTKVCRTQWFFPRSSAGGNKELVTTASTRSVCKVGTNQ